MTAGLWGTFFLYCESSLAGYQKPIGVAEWKNQMVQALPEELRSSNVWKCKPKEEKRWYAV